MSAIDLGAFIPEKHWVCPNCTTTHVTRERLPHAPFHPCGGLKGLTSPLVEDGTACKVVIAERGDYVGGELVAMDGEGRPVMSVVTVRDDGMDCAVLAPIATGARTE